MYEILYREIKDELEVDCETVTKCDSVDNAISALNDSLHHMNKEHIYCRKIMDKGLPKLILDIDPHSRNIIEIRQINTK